MKNVKVKTICSFIQLKYVWLTKYIDTGVCQQYLLYWNLCSNVSNILNRIIHHHIFNYMFIYSHMLLWRRKQLDFKKIYIIEKQNKTKLNNHSRYLAWTVQLKVNPVGVEDPVNSGSSSKSWIRIQMFNELCCKNLSIAVFIHNVFKYK